MPDRPPSAWKIDLFNNLKRWWGISNLWQQSRTALELWMQIRSTGLDVGPTAESGGRRCLPDEGGATLAHEAAAHRRSGGAMAAHGIYRTCVSRRLRPQVPEIRLPGTAQRPPFEALALHRSDALHGSSRFVVGIA